MISVVDGEREMELRGLALTKPPFSIQRLKLRILIFSKSILRNHVVEFRSTV